VEDQGPGSGGHHADENENQQAPERFLDPGIARLSDLFPRSHLLTE
jgi:hypothetical protein